MCVRLLLLWPLGLVSIAGAQPPRYDDVVVAKAEAFLAEAGLKRSGGSILVADAADWSRDLAALGRTRRELQQLAQAHEAIGRHAAEIEMTLDAWQRQNADLNLQLAAVPAGDVPANNRFVGLINAGRAQAALMRKQRTRLLEQAANQQRQLRDAEADYAQAVFDLQRRLEALQTSIDQSLVSSNLQTAMRVLARNHDVVVPTSAADVLGSLSERLNRLRREIFSESVPLIRTGGGSLKAIVAVGGQSVEMILDTGADMVTMSDRMATQLGIEIPENAPPLRLVLANGDSIAARQVTLPSVRVGPFEATDVSAAVLTAAGENVQPLLGQSYLGRFRYEVNADAATLTLLQVGQDPP